MRRLTTCVLFFFQVVPVFCQVLLNDSASGNGERFFQPGKFDYGVTLGSEFTVASGFGSGLNTYIAPHFSYNLNKRLSIGGGISIIQTNYFKTRSYFQNEQSAGTTGNFTSGMIFIDGQYIVNKRLTVYGSAFKQFPITQDPLSYNPYSPVSSKGAQGINFNIGYKIGDHMYIQAGFRYSEGLNPVYTDPFNRNAFMNDSWGAQPGFGIPRW
jgi:hypothetical protein